MTSERALLIAVYVAMGGVCWLIFPYLTPLLFAAVMAVLAWPVQEGMARRLGGRRRPAALLTLILLTVGVVGPAGPLLVLITREVSALVTSASEGLRATGWEELLARLDALPFTDRLSTWTGKDHIVSDTLRDAADNVAQAVGGLMADLVPNLFKFTFQALIKTILFYLAGYTLLVRGPTLLAVARRVSPLPERHLLRLFEVFASFARSVVLAGLAAATSQGIVATLGFLLAGVEQAILFGFMSGLLSFVPLIGSLVVWAPVVTLLIAQGRLGAALFLGLWSAIVTGTVDNFVRPLVLRGRSDVPTVLIFLGVFGGLYWMGIVGLLVGPVMVAMLLALLRIHAEEADAAQGSIPGR